MDRADVQALVFSGFADRPASAAFFLDFTGSDARDFLRRLLPSITSGSPNGLGAPCAYNIAFTAPGLAWLGVPVDLESGFSREFVQGMAHPERAATLGDYGEDAPDGWELGSGNPPVHAVLLVYATDPTELARAVDTLEEELEFFEVPARRLMTYLPSDGREHFGFAMGVSQPGFTLRERRQGKTRVPYGEFLLGYANAFGSKSPIPTAPLVRSTRELPPWIRRGRRVCFGYNGSYLALRKLEQRTDAFHAYTRARAESESVSPERVAARLVGRWPNGAALALYPDAPPTVAPERDAPFRYRELDPEGARCPLSAHVRRANPRDELGGGARRHRLLRRGRLYGPSVEATAGQVERGLLFLALNADLSRQFETVQSSFLDGRGFGPPGEPDVIAGRHPDAPRFVRVRGGLYAFLPSVRALNYLVDAQNPRVR